MMSLEANTATYLQVRFLVTAIEVCVYVALAGYEPAEARLMQFPQLRYNRFEAEGKIKVKWYCCRCLRSVTMHCTCKTSCFLCSQMPAQMHERDI